MVVLRAMAESTTDRKTLASRRREILAHLETCLANSHRITVGFGLESEDMREETLLFDTFLKDCGHRATCKGLFSGSYKDGVPQLGEAHPSACDLHTGII